MSVDVLLAHRCPHEIVEERAYLGPDRLTLVSSQTLTTANTTTVIVNDEILVPSQGLYAQAYLKSSLSGPFKVNKRETTFTVETPTETVSIELPYNTLINTSDIVTELKKKVKKIIVSNIGGYLGLLDIGTLNSSSYLKVKGTSLEKLGFVQRGSKGKQIYPSWQLVDTPGLTSSRANRFVRFTDMIKTNPVFKLTYITRPEECTRCRATGIENDMKFNSAGDVILIGDENLLTQAILKIVLTHRGSNPFFLWYGSNLHTLLGSKAVNRIKVSIEQDVRNAIENYKQIQTEQAKYQMIPAGQRFYQLVSVDVLESDQNPSLYKLDITVSNASREAIPISIVYTVGDVITLPGSNGLTLNLDRAGLLTSF